MLGPWLPFPPAHWAQVPEGPGVYVLADGRVNVLAIVGTRDLRRALQELAAAPPLPLKDLATHLCVEATAEPEGRRAELIAAFRAQTGAFPPCNRRHPRYPAQLRAWWRTRGGWKRLPAETVDVSSVGVQLVLEKPPAPGAGGHLRVETPLGWIKALGRVAWTGRQAEAHRAGIALTRLQGADDRHRWDRLIGELAARVAHA